MPLAPDPAADHQVGLLEHAQVLQHRGAIEFGQFVAQLAGGAGGLFQGIEHAATNR